MKVKGQMSKVKCFVGLSGGVDSSVSAALLKQAKPNNFEKLFGCPTPEGFRGFDVTGVFIKVWQPDWLECTWREDRLDAMRVCAKLEIPFVELNFEKEYKREVVDYMISEYKTGRTPNPDVMCNKHVKFGAFYNWAMKHGADYVATGHYARIMDHGTRNIEHKKSGKRDAPCSMLCVACDSNKDQSYFLWQIRKEQLPYILFPIGGFLKPEVRKLAKKFGMVTADKKDSQGLCFMGKVDMKDFLKRYIKPKDGKVLSESGRVIGRHQGAQFFTLGERHGLEITKKTASEKPYYIIGKDIKKNTLTVSNYPQKSEGGDNGKVFEVGNLNWFSTTSRTVLEVVVLARFRYRQPLQLCHLKCSKPGLEHCVVTFYESQNGGASGQSVVFYAKDGKTCLGGGIIV